jgi:hypothetical protein
MELRVMIALLASEVPVLNIRHLVDILFDDDLDGGPTCANRGVTKLMMKLRTKLHELGLSCPKSKSGRGYWIVDLWSDQAELREAA